MKVDLFISSNDHMLGILPESLYRKLALADDHSVNIHRQTVPSFRFWTAKEPGRVNPSGMLPIVQLLQ